MKSKNLFKDGFNCAQSVFVPFAIDNNLDKETALRIMGPFGGGIAKTNNICGAVSGAIAAIGLYFGQYKANDSETKLKCNAITQTFIAEFKQKFNSTQCTDLIGYNLSIDDESKQAAESDVFKSKCTMYVEKASEMVTKLIMDNSK